MATVPANKTELQELDLSEAVNNLVGVNKKAVYSGLRNLKSERKRLEEKLSSAVSSGEVSDQWDELKREVREALAHLDQLKVRCGDLQASKHDALVREAQSFSQQFVPLTLELEELGSCERYLNWLEKIRSHSDKMAALLGSSVEGAVSEYTALEGLGAELGPWEGSHLTRYWSQMKECWFDRLKTNLLGALHSDLRGVGWPFVSGAQPTESVWAGTARKMGTTLLLLFTLETDYRYSPLRTLSEPLPLAVAGLVEGLEKRFVFHFYGDRPTNDKTKPEWMLSQVLAWLRTHGAFVQERLQPLLAGSAHSSVNLRAELTRGLLRVLGVKLRDAVLTSERVVQDSALMTHWISELLLFDQELRALHYPHPLPSCAALLLEDAPFSQWMLIEKKLAVDKLSTVMASPRAWSNLTGSMDSTEVSIIPECAEKLMSIIAGIRERYQVLPSLPHHLDFLNLQLYLLLEFHCDLSTALQQVPHSSPLAPEPLAYLNACHYILQELASWQEEPFFLELAYAHQWISGEPPGSQLDASFCGGPFSLEEFTSDFARDPALFHLSSPAFHRPIQAFQEIAFVMQDRIAEYIISEFAAAVTKIWRKEKWHVLPSPKEYAITAVSAGGLRAMAGLRDHLLAVSRNVTPELREEVWFRIVGGVDEVIVKELVSSVHFSEGGAAQLRVDVLQNLVPLLSQFTGLTSDQLLTRSRDCCVLLNLLPGSVRLLLDLLSPLAHPSSSSQQTGAAYDSCLAALKDVKVNQFTPQEAFPVLKRRMLES